MPKKTTPSHNTIEIKGARVHNLKNISLSIPRDKLVVITGVSGSGKSSLAFDTLYAEGQRRYVESLSSYARQFLGRINKPEVDFIRGIPPAIAIEQKVNTRNPRSTVGTSTEIYDYLKLLFARIGKTYSPLSGELVTRHSVSDVADYCLSFQEGTIALILAPFKLPKERSLAQQLDMLRQQGFTRIQFVNKKKQVETLRIKDAQKNIDQYKNYKHFYLLIDRVRISNDEDSRSRLADSVQTAFFEGHGECVVNMETDLPGKNKTFSNRFEADGIQFETPTVHTFSFNNPLGACPRCEGFGSVIGIDPDLVVPDKSLSVYDDAIACWRGEKMSQWKQQLIITAHKFNFPLHRPFNELTEIEIDLLWTGNQYFNGLNSFFDMLEQEGYKIQYRVMLSRYRGKTTCPDCKGSRLKKEANYVKVADHTIQKLVLMPITELYNFFRKIELSDYDQKIAKRLLIEINNRLRFLLDVGLGYLTLNRLSASLSGGESQRINLATSLGSSLVGSMYILDEPSIGLHSRDTERLIAVLRQLQKLGNSVIVVEHDEDIIRAADDIIDIGPMAGRLGGEIVAQGPLKNLLNKPESLTTRYLTNLEVIPTPIQRKQWKSHIRIEKASAHNLKDISVNFPLNVMTVVTGVSGSGKSTLVNTILFRALNKMLNGAGEQSGQHKAITGDLDRLAGVEFVDQNPIGRSSRSNPVTYIKAYDDIRKLYAEQQAAKINNFKASHFSFNVDGGRCEICQGEGSIRVEMQFMADVFLVCEACQGHRFKEEVLEVKYKGKNIYNVLDMTVDEALDFFQSEKRIAQRLQLLADVGLGYIKLGQSSNTLSGGESQRVKLAAFLSRERSRQTGLFIFDEPTIGLHFHDINKLLGAFRALIDNGNTVIIIEHNMDVIKCADWVIDLGPEGGQTGGHIVFEGTPENLSQCKESYTGQYLKEKFEQENKLKY